MVGWALDSGSMAAIKQLEGLSSIRLQGGRDPGTALSARLALQLLDKPGLRKLVLLEVGTHQTWSRAYNLGGKFQPVRLSACTTGCQHGGVYSSCFFAVAASILLLVTELNLHMLYVAVCFCSRHLTSMMLGCLRQ